MPAKQVRELLVAKPGDRRFRLIEIDPDTTPGLKGKHRAKTDLARHRDSLFKLQERLYAERKRALLVVLQAMDTGGKDGTVTHVIGNMNPQAVLISSFMVSCGGSASDFPRRATSASSIGRITRTCWWHAFTTWRLPT